MEQFILVLIVSIAGFLGGFLGGQVGGGALVTLPVLLAIGLPPSIAIGTNAVHGVFGNLTSGLRHLKNKSIDFKKLLPYLILVFLGAVIGAQINLYFNQLVLKKIIAWLLASLLLITLLKEFFNKQIIEFEKRHKKGMAEFALVSIFFLGIYGGLFTIAITTLIAFLFLLARGDNFLNSMANSFMASTFCMLGASLVYINHNAVNFFYLFPLTIATAFGAWLGADFAIKKGERWIQWLFWAIVIILILKLLLNL